MLIALLGSSLALAATLTVGPEGDYGSIGSAISASSDGDRIEVSEGTYIESINLGLKDVEVIGVDGLEVTSIIGDGFTPTVSISDESTSSTRLTGFTLQGAGKTCIEVEGGTPQLDTLALNDCGSTEVTVGGALVIRGGSLNMSALTIQNSTAGSGGGLFCNDATLSITDSEFTSNRAAFGSGGGLRLVDCDTTLSGVTVENNVAAINGGGVSARGEAFRTTDSTRFVTNAATYGTGGAIDLVETDEFASTSTSFNENTARNSGGAIRLFSVVEADINDSTFDGNEATASTSSGGAVFVQNTAIQLTSSAFNNNRSGNFGGGIASLSSDITGTDIHLQTNITDGYGGALHTSAGSVMLTDATIAWNEGLEGGAGLAAVGTDVSIVDSSIDWNTAAGGYGGGLHLAHTNTSLNRINIRANGEQIGGGLHSTGSGSLQILRSVIQENEATFAAGGAHLSGATDATVWFNDFLGNETMTSGTAAQLHITTERADLRNNIVVKGVNGTGIAVTDADATVLTVRHNNVWANDGFEFGGIEDPTGTAGNIEWDPLFVELSLDQDFTNDNLYLQHDSPCLDAADPETADLDGVVSSIGAFGVTDIPAIDADGDGYPPDAGGDCNDEDPTIHPGTDEICGDDVDNNCDGVAEEGCDGDTGDPGDSEDTGYSPPDTGAAPEDKEDRTDDSQSDITDTDDLYAIEGKGCRCSAPSGQAHGAAGLFFTLLLALGRRRT